MTTGERGETRRGIERKKGKERNGIKFVRQPIAALRCLSRENLTSCVVLNTAIPPDFVTRGNSYDSDYIVQMYILIDETPHNY